MMAYIVLSVLWSCFAVRMQLRLHGWSWWRVPFVAVLNFAACPLCVIMATFRDPIEKHAGSAVSLVDGAYEIVELFKPQSPAQAKWRESWMAQARGIGAGPE